MKNLLVAVLLSCVCSVGFSKPLTVRNVEDQETNSGDKGSVRPPIPQAPPIPPILIPKAG